MKIYASEMHCFLFAQPMFWPKKIAQCCLENLCGRANPTPYDIHALDRLIYGNPVKRPPHNMLYVDGQSVVANPLVNVQSDSYTLLEEARVL
jgi:hypothetical protein